MNAQKNKILSVTIEHRQDESPDLSWLGEYTSQPARCCRLVRKTGQLLDASNNVLATNGPKRWQRDTYEFIHRFQNDDSQWPHVSDADVCKSFLRERYTANRRGLPTANAFDYFGVIGWQNATTREQKIRCLNSVYMCLDARRLENYGADWSCIGVIAKATILVNGTQQNLRSGGLWGVESDSSPEYFADLHKEQLAELRDVLSGLGFGKRAIDFAFKNPVVKQC